MSTTYPDDEVVTTSYNVAGQPAALSSSLGTSYVTEATYTPEGRLDVLSLGSNLQVDRDYYAWETPNGQGRLQRLQAGPSSDPTSLQNLSYTYDGVGNVASITDNGQTTNFTYDALDRLTEASGPYSQSYSYDAIGNITYRSDVGAYSYSSGRPHAVTAAGSHSYGYDAAGNMTSRDGDTLTYDAENRLQSVTSGGETVAFTYDGEGRRVLRDTVTDTAAYAGPHYELQFNKTNKPEDLDDDCRITVIDIMRVVAQWGAQGPGIPEDVNDDQIVDITDVQQVAGLWRETCHVLVETVKYYNLGNRRVAMRKVPAEPPNAPGTLYYLFSDHLGSTSVTYNTANGQTQTLRYYPWGGVRTGDVPTDRRFTGQRWDSTIDLYDYQARFYDPALGRFTQPDPIVPEPGNPQSLNRYAYTHNNPLRYRDSSGNTPWDVVDVGFWLWSAKDFIEDPSWGNAGWWALDTLSLLPLLPSVGWVRRGGQVIFSADEARDIARLGSHARDFVRIAHIPGAERLLANLLSTSGTTRRGAEFELEFALRHANEVEEISRVLEVVQGGEKEIDFVLKGDVFVNVKNLDWAEYKPFVLERHTERMVEEAMSFLKYDPNAVKYVFKSSVPDSVREALEAAGIIVEVVP